MIFNKKGLFGGGLCLVNTAVIAISTSSVVVAEECSVLNKQNQIYWRIYAHNMRLNATEKSAWIKDEEYRDSIINVIGKAIGDCMALENEFEDCSCREDLGDKIILFEGKDKYKDPYDYTIKNWNAVYLYNAVNLAINNERYWGVRAVRAAELLEECHRRIKNYYEQFYWIHTEDDKKRQRRNVSELDEQEKLIKKFLNQRYNEVIAPENWGFSQEDIDNIQKLQKAINNLDKNKGDIENLVKDAIDKLNVAKTVLRGRMSFKEEYLTRERKKMYDIEIYKWIKDYVLNRRDCTIASLELHKNLEQAKSDILEYFQALNLDKILKDVYGLYSEDHPFSPAEQTKEKFKEKENRYDTFQYDILMNLNVTNTGKTDSECPIMQEIGYQPHFFIKNGHEWQDSEFYHGKAYEPINTIYIYGVSKLKRTKSEDPLYKNETETLESYEWKESDNYKELLKLLQGLVIPYGKKVVRI